MIKKDEQTHDGNDGSLLGPVLSHHPAEIGWQEPTSRCLLLLTDAMQASFSLVAAQRL